MSFAESRDWTIRQLPGAVLWGGTLLGQIRENRILPWDKDVDIAVDRFQPLPAEEYRRAAFEPWMTLYVPEAPHGNVGYMVKGVKVGIHILMGEGEWRYYTRYPGQLVKVPNPWPANGDLPADPERVLGWLYGPSWRKQVRNYIGSRLHRQNQKRWLITKPEVVYADGVWDLFHEGHRRLLERAAEFGESLVVGVKSDDATERQKGRRPVWSQAERMEAVSQVCDRVVAYDESNLDEQPDVFVHGDDWHHLDRSHLENEAKRIGCHIVLLERTPGVSTSMLR